MLAAASARHMQRRGVGNRAGAAYAAAHNGISVVTRHRIICFSASASIAQRA
jgi:hypothetical protein